jgi:hypothetical protein
MPGEARGVGLELRSHESVLELSKERLGDSAEARAMVEETAPSWGRREGGGSVKTDKPTDIHVMPDDGKHASSVNCFCEPVLDYQDDFTGKRVWVHKGPEELCN